MFAGSAKFMCKVAEYSECSEGVSGGILPRVPLLDTNKGRLQTSNVIFTI